MAQADPLMTDSSRSRGALRLLAATLLAWPVLVLAQGDLPTDYVERGASLPCLDEVYGLRVHVIAPTPEQNPPSFSREALDSMVARANAAFAPICVGFEVCEVLELENYRYAEDSLARRRERRALYTDPRRIDLFIAVEGGSEPYGQATQLGIAQRDSAYVEVPRAQVFGGSKALTHVLGHYFGLYDTWEAEEFGAELVAQDNCETAGDLVCDTPADPYDPTEPVAAYVDAQDPCRFTFRGQDIRFRFYVAHTANAMSYYSEECDCGLTAGQLRRVAANVTRFGEGVF